MARRSLFMLAMPALFLGGSASAQNLAAQPDLALHKKYVTSDPNVSGWDTGLTDGAWNPDRGQTFATGDSPLFPKTATVDLEAPTSLGYVALGTPPYGSTKTVTVSVSTNGTEFTTISRYVFSLNKGENHLLTVTPVVARYVRLTYVDHYADAAGFSPNYAFTSELAVYAPGPPPVLPPGPAGPEPADAAAPKRGDDGAMNADFLASHESFLRRGKAGPIGVLFLGDSITHRWSQPNVQDLWQQHFGQYAPANFGIEGDKTQHVLWRIDNGELTGIHPKVVVLLLGTNNIGYPVDDIVKGDKKIVEEIHRRLPETKVLLLGIFPRGGDPNDPARAKIKAVNTQLARLDDGGKTRFLDFGDKFLDANGGLPAEMMPDALHPSPKGYQIWADAMQPLLDTMMRQDK